MLVNVSGVVPFPINRVTLAVWEAFTSPMGHMPTRPLGGSQVTDVSRLSRLGDVVSQKMKAGELTDGWVVMEYEGHRIWAMPNGTQFGYARPDAEGWTIMFPEDY